MGPGPAAVQSVKAGRGDVDMAEKKGKSEWLLPGVLILFLLEVLLFPLATGVTYSGRSESPDHVLTYTTGNLSWDSATGIASNGAAELELFDTVYQNVQSENGDQVLAPGTEAQSIVRLKNDMNYEIRYVAVMYHIKEQSQLPVEPVLQGDGFADTDDYVLPEGVSRDQVVRAVTGLVGGGEIQDFDLYWQWNFYESDQRDQVDTALGNQAAFATADDMSVGLYIIVVEENYPYGTLDGDCDLENGCLSPEVPRTGDDSPMIPYVVLMTVSGVVLVLLALERWREKWR